MSEGEVMEHNWGMNLVIDVELHMALKCSKESRTKGEEYVCNCESPFDWPLEKLLEPVEVPLFTSFKPSACKASLIPKSVIL